VNEPFTLDDRRNDNLLDMCPGVPWLATPLSLVLVVYRVINRLKHAPIRSELH